MKPLFTRFLRSAAIMLGLTVAFIVWAMMFLVIGGCRTKVVGGSEQSDVRGFNLATHPDGTFDLRDSRERTATTHPSVETSDAQAFKYKPAEGSFDISFQGVKKAAMENWWAMVILMGAGVFAIFVLKQKLAGILFIGAGLAAGLYPITVLIGGGVLLIVVLGQWWEKRQQDAQIADGIDHAKRNDPNAKDAIGYMAEKIDRSVQAAIGMK